ncbi:Usp family protein [Gordonia terrae]|uniref:Usp family protein n=1 Tax=Gordonia terrae TaxID=2055 RepID=A0AAD0K5K2_9ACTN|nr:Usp family protein [Gordonia terrae]VTR07340.1 Universal stress protein Rv2623/MT2698 [Clostridioides difficile]VTS43686.1 Universal stress protein Rv2623/MT2698 [Gordonia terrae]
MRAVTRGRVLEGTDPTGVTGVRPAEGATALTASTIVGIDGSATARTAACWAARDARLHDSPLQLVSAACPSAGLVAESPQALEPLRRRAERALSDSRRAIAESGQAIAQIDWITSRIECAPPIPTLLDASSAARMLVVGNRGHRAADRVPLGSVAVALAEHCRSPLTVVRDPGPVVRESLSAAVVVGVDGSRASRRAATAAFAEAAVRGVALTVVHAWSDSDGSDRDPTTVSPEHDLIAWRNLRTRVATGWLDDELRSLRADHPTVRVRCSIVRDRPARALLDHAQAAQLVVIGARGRGGFDHMLLGSTGRAVLHGARCPVMVIPPDR